MKKGGESDKSGNIDFEGRYAGFSTAGKVWAALQHGELSPRAFNYLLAEFGSLETLLEAEASDLQERFKFDDSSALRLAAASEFLPQSEAFINTLSLRNIEFVTIFDGEYPVGLRELNDPPPIIFYRGALIEDRAKSVALVGSSNATQEGIAVAVDFGARAGANGVTLVSGLTSGVDSSALIGALSAEGKTCAVALAGFENPYPQDCAPLLEQIVRSGCVFSEYSPELEFCASHTTEANRLTSALAQAVVIGEVRSDSVGALDVAQSCVESGKLLFVLVPTEVPIHDEKALEPFARLGAVPVRFPEDMDTILRCLV